MRGRDQTHVIDTISQRSDWKMGFCLTLTSKQEDELKPLEQNS